MHAAGLLLLIFGAHLFPAPVAAPLVVSEIEVITEAEYFAQLQQHQSLATEQPNELAPPPAEDAAAEVESKVADAAVETPSAQLLTSRTAVPEGAAERPEITPPPRVRVVPSEAPKMTIAEVPIPDSLALPQAVQPESKPATEQLSALASAPALIAPAPVAPRPVTPLPQPEEATETPEETQEELAEAAQPDAPKAPAPREAKLPVARPANLARAAPATGAPDTPGAAEKPSEVAERAPEKPADKPAAEAQPKPADTPAEKPAAKPAEPKPAGGGSRFASVFSRGEKEALSLALKPYFTYTGNRSDPSLHVTVAIGLDQTGKIVSGPELLRAEGGDQATRDALFQAGRRALLKAQNAGVFARLPASKYDAWQLIHVTFFPDERVGFPT